MALLIRYHSDAPLIDFPKAIAEADRQHRATADLRRGYQHWRAAELRAEDAAERIALAAELDLMTQQEIARQARIYTHVALAGLLAFGIGMAVFAIWFLK